MAISFNDIPNTIRVPLAYIEFDNSGALTGTAAVPYKLLVLGQQNADATAPALTPVRITGADQAGEMFGRGSMLHNMLRLIKGANSHLETWALPAKDNSAGKKAAATVTLSGRATASGTLYLYIDGQAVSCAVTADEELSATAARLASAINAENSLPVTASAPSEDGGAVVTLTCRWPGESGNGLSAAVSLYGEDVPAGLGVACAEFAGGSGDPDIDEVIAALGDEQWHGIVLPWTGKAGLASLAAELDRRWGPMVQKESITFTAFRGTHGETAEFGANSNSHLITCMGTGDAAPQAPYLWAAVYGVVALASLETDPARPLQTLELAGIIPPPLKERWTMEERNLLLHDGIATYMVQAGDIVAIEREVAMYQTNKWGEADPSYLDITTPATLGYIRYATKSRITQKYPRHKLASDGTRYSPGQAIVTPSVIRGELLALYRELEYAGIVENFDAYKADLIVERNGSDRNRVDVLAPPDIVNQFRIFAMKTMFVL